MQAPPGMMPAQPGMQPGFRPPPGGGQRAIETQALSAVEVEKKSKLPLILAAVAVLALVAGGAFFFLNSGPGGGTVSIDVRPEGVQATILLDGEPYSPESGPIVPGQHTLEISAPGYRTTRESLEVVDGATLALRIALEANTVAGEPRAVAPPTNEAAVMVEGASGSADTAPGAGEVSADSGDEGDEDGSDTTPSSAMEEDLGLVAVSPPVMRSEPDEPREPRTSRMSEPRESRMTTPRMATTMSTPRMTTPRMTTVAMAAAMMSSPMAAGNGRLNALANPRATVFVDGRRIGQTPLLNRTFPAGSHRVELRLSDGRSHTQSVNLTDGRAVTVRHNF